MESDLPLGVRLLKRLLDDAFAAGRTEVIAEVMAADVVEHQFGLASTGAEAHERVRRAAQQVHDLAPDTRYTIDDWAGLGGRHGDGRRQIRNGDRRRELIRRVRHGAGRNGSCGPPRAPPSVR